LGADTVSEVAGGVTRGEAILVGGGRGSGTTFGQRR